MSNVEQLKYYMVKTIAEKLLQPNNTLTTLEVKLGLISTYPEYHWQQEYVSKMMRKLEEEGDFYVSNDNGTYRTYSAKSLDNPKQTDNTTMATTGVVKIGRTKVLETLQSSKGRFLTVDFVKKDNSERVMNCKYSGHDDLGYATVTETKSKTTKKVNLQTVKSIKFGGITYIVK